MICVPLRHRHHVVGVLKVLSPVPDAFDERDERALELVGGLAAAAVHRAQSDRQLAAHHTVARALAEAGSLSGGVSGALRGLGEALGWDFGALWLATEDGATLQCQDVWHLATVPAAPYGRAARDSAPVRGEGTIGGVWDTCRPSWVEDIRAQAPVPADGARAESAASAHLRTIVDVAVVANGEVLGVLELAAREERAEDPEMEDLVAVVAAQIGQFVQRKRAQNHIREQAENLSSVVELAQSIGRLRDPARFRPALCTAMRDVTGADQVALFELDDSGERLVLTAQKGDHLADGLVLAVDGPSAVATAFRTGEGDYVADTSNDARVDRDVARSSGLRTAFLEPLLRDGEAIGVVSISWHRLQRTDPAGKRTLMRLLAAESANALERADLVVMLDASARTDQLTGVANRRAWDDELGRELARSQRAGTPLCLALIDLDHFKAYNDTHGHPAGDRLLRESAARWDARLRTTDLLSRYGGEEFAVLLPGCRDGVAGAVADDLRTAMPAGATCSIGVAQWDGIESAEALVARVDAALYDAKDQGRDRVVVAGGGARAKAA
jgi:diguanylate cyclase (GGDEF)-like protein